MVRWPLSVQYLDWFVAITSESIEADIQESPLLVLQEGKLSLCEPQAASDWTQHELCQQTEYCWPFIARDAVGDMYNSLWAFDGSNVKVGCSKIKLDDSHV